MADEDKIIETQWLHKGCGGVVEPHIGYSDAEQDYYFNHCNKCGGAPEITEMELSEIPAPDKGKAKDDEIDPGEWQAFGM